MLSTMRPHLVSAVPVQRRQVAKAILHGRVARERMLLGALELRATVANTLGPRGRNVILEQMNGPPKVTKDGVTVAKAIQFRDKGKNAGAQLLKVVASKAGVHSGDGTTTATVLGEAIFREGLKAVAAGMNPMDVKRGIDAAVKKVTENIAKHAIPVKSTEELLQVATISANGDKVIGSLIAKAHDLAGSEGTITISDGSGAHEVEFQAGMRFDSGLLSIHFATDMKSKACHFAKPLIFLHEDTISTQNIEVLIPVLDHAAASRRPLFIVAENIKDEALSMLIINKAKGNIQVAAVKGPGFNDHQKGYLHDIAVVTGGQVFSKDSVFNPAMLGTAQSVEASQSSTLIAGGAGCAGGQVDERVADIRREMGRVDSEYEKVKFKERIARLRSGIALIKVGGTSRFVAEEVKDRLNDALCATRAALEEGTVAGGGAALLHASQGLNELKGSNISWNVGVDIVASAARRPLESIARNAGVSGNMVVKRVVATKNVRHGYDAISDSCTDMLDAGIVDPAKVVRVALVDAASVATLMTTTEALILEDE